MASRMQQKGKAPKGYSFRHQQVTLPWGVTVQVISADLQA
jgi:hypothetical protein